MINITVVTYNQKIITIEATGHSGYEEAGKDIVCSAVSSIVITTINGRLSLDKEGILVDTKKSSKERALQLFAYASSNEGGDDLQQMLAKYDWIVAHYNGCADFLSNDAGTNRGAVASSAKISPLMNVIGSNNITAIIVIISMVSLTAIGGYFFLKHRKEN